MSAKRTDKKTEQTSVSRAIADLEAVDAALAKLVSSELLDETSTPTHGPIAETRELLRAAITKLASAQLAISETMTGKRRVKIKAVGDISKPDEAGTTAAKATSRRKPTELIAKPPTSSLLARLGAASAATREPSAVATDPTASETKDAAPTIDAGISAEEAVDRLARLEAEIESLTHPPAVAAQTVAAANASAKDPATEARAAPPRASSTTSSPHRTIDPTPLSPVPDADYEDEDDVEVTIIGGKSNPRSRPGTTEDRPAPRVLRHVEPTASDDADVEIVRPGDLQRNARTPSEQEDSLRIDPTSPNARSKEVSPSRWRLFRGSR